MSERESTFLKKLQSTLWTAFGGLLLTIIITVVPFYFNQTNETNNLKEQVHELKASKADKDIYELTVRQIQRELKSINEKLDDGSH